MVSLSNPSPNPPVHGESVSVTATNGYPDYTFKWYIGEGEEQTITQSSPEFTCTIPDDSEGKTLRLKVKDSNGDRDANSWSIS